MKKPTKAYEVIYVNSFITPTKEGHAITFMAMDAFSEYMFPPAGCQQGGATDNEFTETLMGFFNEINQQYDRTKHADKTTYVVNFPPELHPLIQGMLMKGDSLEHNPEKVQQAFKPLLEKFQKSR